MLGLGNEFPIISSNLKAGYGVFGTADPYNTSLPNNGALNPPGSVYFVPSAAQAGVTLASAAGYGAGLWVKYVRYFDEVASPVAMVSGPAPVYWKDETFTLVTGDQEDGFIGSGNSGAAAGWLLPNTGSVSGVGVGSAITAAILNNPTGGSQGGSWVFIGIAGFIPSAYLAAGSAGQWVYASGDFATTGVAMDGATTYSDFKFIGMIISTVGSNIADVWALGTPF